MRRPRSGSRRRSSTRASRCACRATPARRRSSSANTSAGTRRGCGTAPSCASACLQSSRWPRRKPSSPNISRVTASRSRPRMFEQLPFATIDHLRPITQGHQEVIFCPDKTIGQVVAIAERLEAAGGSFLATRADPGQSAALATRFPRAELNGLGRTVYLPPDPEPAPTGRGTILVCTAGTSDLRSEEHTSELQSRENLVCRLLLEKKKRE